MTQAHLVADLTDDAVLVAFFLAAFFAVSYTVVADWWRHALGTSLVVTDIGLVLALGPSVLHRMFGLNLGSLAFAWYFFGSLAFIAAGVAWRTVVMLRASRDNPRVLKLRRFLRWKGR